MMSIIKISLKALGFATILASTSVYATNITVGGSSVSVDDRQYSDGSGDDAAYGGSAYNINQMNVSWSADNTITVDIFTDFANTSNYGRTNNNRFEYSGRKITYGDLMIGVDNGSDFNYAFSLGADRWNRYTFSDSDSGGLYKIDKTYSSTDWHSGAERDGIVSASTRGLTEIDSNSSWGVSQGKISFSFNVAGLSVFTNAQSLALSWAETCFNDDVGETFAVRRNRPVVGVPEPGTVLLMLLALGGLVYSRRNKNGHISA